MIFQVKITPGVNSFHLLKSDGKLVFNITGSFGIMGQFHMIMETVFFFWYTQVKMPLHSLGFPVFVPFVFSAGAYKKLHLHLLKFAHPENKLSRNNLITKCFSYLGNSERNLHPSGFLNVQEVYKDSLGGLWSQVNLARIFCN